MTSLLCVGGKFDGRVMPVMPNKPLRHGLKLYVRDQAQTPITVETVATVALIEEELYEVLEYRDDIGVLFYILHPPGTPCGRTFQILLNSYAKAKR